jgi:hypothetical protein
MREVTGAVDTREVVVDSLAAEADSEAAAVAAKRVRVNFWGRSRLRKPCGPWLSMKSGRKASSIPRPHVCLPNCLNLSDYCILATNLGIPWPLWPEYKLTHGIPKFMCGT